MVIEHSTAREPQLQTHGRLGQLLVASDKLTPRDLDRALAAQGEMGSLLGRVLVRLGLVSETDLAQVLSKQLGVPYRAPVDVVSVDGDVPGLLAEFAAAHALVPLEVRERSLHVAMAVPQDDFVVKALAMATGLQVVPYIATEASIEAALSPPMEELDDRDVEAAEGGEFVEQLKDLASEAPVIRLVNALVGKVTELRASDIHLEPFDAGLHVRYRVDGALMAPEVLPAQQGAAVVSRVKLLAHLDIAERRLPQDGRIRTRVKGRELDLRVSTVPTVHGESVVLRVLDRSSVRFGLEDMGFEGEILRRFQELLARPHGILLVTGPTGSGKTTTLYAALSTLDAVEQKIITVEDPVEYQLEGINQIQVHAQIGLSFAGALRSILRQDPDIIMIGEMRDGETAQIAVQSALTGHLVLSTLHTNTAAGAIVRMKDMGVEGYLITSSVNAVLAQRLVRTLCTACKLPDDAPSASTSVPGLREHLQPGRSIYRPVGCAQCGHTGYRGRTAIHELLVMDEPLRQSVAAGADASTLNALATAAGMRTLYQDGLRRVAQGQTTLQEVLRVAQDAGEP